MREPASRSPPESPRPADISSTLSSKSAESVSPPSFEDRSPLSVSLCESVSESPLSSSENASVSVRSFRETASAVSGTLPPSPEAFARAACALPTALPAFSILSRMNALPRSHSCFLNSVSASWRISYPRAVKSEFRNSIVRGMIRRTKRLTSILPNASSVIPLIERISLYSCVCGLTDSVFPKICRLLTFSKDPSNGSKIVTDAFPFSRIERNFRPPSVIT